MPSRKVRELLDAFRSHFQADGGAEVPLALRREPSDVVFVGMLSDDAPDKARPSPVLFEQSSDPLGDVAAQFGPAMHQALQASPGDLGQMLGMDMGAGDAQAPTGAPAAPQAGVLPEVPLDLSGLG